MKKNVTKRIHKDIFPHTDHGHTWIETCWYIDPVTGNRCSPQFPVAGACERLMHLPGGPIPTPDWEFEERNFNVIRELKTEITHDGSYKVGTVSIVKV